MIRAMSLPVAVAHAPAGHGAVAAGNAATAAAAAAVLRAGGSAVDAVLAGGFAAPVAEPALSSLGGGGFLLVRRPDGETSLLDFFTETPGRGAARIDEPHFEPVTIRFAGAEQVFHVGAGSVAVPGVLDGYLHAHEAWGRLPLAEVVAPAAALARDGAVVDEAQAYVLRLVGSILALLPEGRALYARDGRIAQAGDLLVNPDYAGFLERLADRPDAARAALAEALVAAVAAGGGSVTAEDLRAYRPCLRSPLQLRRAGAVVSTNPAPSFGGAIILGSLAVLDPETVRGPGGPAAQAGVLREVTEAQRRAAVDPVGDPVPASVKGTTHISVIDADGWVASMTTSNGSCSGVVVPGFGVHLNNMLGEADLHPHGFHAAAPGTRIASMMAPSLLATDDGTVIGYGSGGSERIRSALLGVTLNLVDRGMDLAEAIAAPRIHPTPEVVDVEPGLSAAELAALHAAGPCREWEAADLFFGGVHAVGRAPDGAVTAVADPRRGGAVAIV